jgi:hypothetical protein
LLTLKKLDAKPPFVVMLSIIELENYSLFHQPNRIHRSWDREFPLKQKDILSEPVIINGFDDNLYLILKKLSQKVWRAAGQAESLNFIGDKLNPGN